MDERRHPEHGCHDDKVELEVAGRTVAVDRCIAPLVEAQNAAGLETVASCCGHGFVPGWIALRDCRQVMIAADLEQARRMAGPFPFTIHGEPLGGSRDGC